MFKLLEDKDLFPAICFSFSKRKCDEYVDLLAMKNLFDVSDEHKNAIRIQIDKALKKIDGI